MLNFYSKQRTKTNNKVVSAFEYLLSTANTSDRKETGELLLRVAEQTRATSILSRLAHDRCSEIRAAVADNIYTPWEKKVHLANDESVDVRYVLAENANTPVDILARLIEDENPYVAHRANKTLQRLKVSIPPVMPGESRQRSA